MRVAVFSYDYSPPIGGLGIVVSSAVSELRRLFPENDYIVFSPSPGSDKKVSPLAAMRWKKRGGCPFFSLILNFKIKKIVKKFKPDVLHAHSGSGGVFILKKPSVPMIVTSHHTYLQEAENVFSNPVLKVWKKFMAILEKRTYSLAQKIVCVSQDTADFIIRRYDQPATKVSVIENGLMIKPVAGRVEKEKGTILFIGRLEKRKGIWVLLEAFNELLKKDPALRLRIAGQNLIGRKIERFIRSNRLTENVFLMGFLQEPLLQRELKLATIIVIPSLLEGFGLIAAEAMLAGTCIAGSAVPGLRSIIKHRETGFLFKTGDSHACAESIEALLKDEMLRNKLATNARSEAERRFSLADRVKEIQDVYRSYRSGT